MTTNSMKGLNENSGRTDSHISHILIVDDDPDQLRLLVMALRNAPYRVSIALNGDQGYARATILQPDLILLDVRMPRRSGITIARLLKTNPLTERIPILFLSAMTDANERLEGLRAGGVDYINKPFNVEEILERIRIHLELSQKIIPSNSSASPLPPNHHSERKTEPDSSASSSTLKKIATDFVLSRLHEPSLKSTDVADNLGISTHRLNVLFNEFYSTSVFEFIRQERMRRAALMLGQSTLAIADIAMEVGYSNSANFSTEFKKFWERSPMNMRSELQKNPSLLQQLISPKPQ